MERTSPTPKPLSSTGAGSFADSDLVNGEGSDAAPVEGFCEAADVDCLCMLPEASTPGDVARTEAER